ESNRQNCWNPPKFRAGITDKSRRVFLSFGPEAAMNTTALAFLTLSLCAGAPDAPKGYQALKSRNLKLDLDVDPKQQLKVSHVELFVSRDRGGVWESVAQVKPDQKF